MPKTMWRVMNMFAVVALPLAWGTYPTVQVATVNVSYAVLGSTPTYTQYFSIASHSSDSGTMGACANMTFSIVTMKSCDSYLINVMNATNITEYELRQRIVFDATNFAIGSSDPGSSFVMSINSGNPPGYSWVPSNTTAAAASILFSGWKQLKYPQDAWVPMSPSCVAGIACDVFPVAPSMRYQHTSVLYSSWNFERDVKGHESLCRTLGYDNAGCTSSCLTDTSCTVNATAIPAGGAWTWTDFYRMNVLSQFWSPYDTSDDGYSFPKYGPRSMWCPNSCCGDRRVCMRTRDNLGRIVPFDRQYLLVFGGRTRQKLLVNGTSDLYQNCEEIQANMTAANTTNSAYGACLEIQSDELWRYDTVEDVWELIKPNSGQPVGTMTQMVPYGRYGHASTLVIVSAEDDVLLTRRQYMYMFGGMSLRCTNGFCEDLWRYEIPWAAQAYWSPMMATSLANYNRGNVWTMMTKCPYGGRFRHSMVEGGGTIYIFGGETLDAWQDALLMYHVAADSWDIVAPLGYRYFTRSAYDYLGDLRLQNLTDFSDFNPLTDTVASTVTWPNSTMLASTKYFPQFPAARGDHAMLVYSETVLVNQTLVNSTTNATSFNVFNETQPVIWLVGGYRTYDPPFPSGDSTYSDFTYYLHNDVWSLFKNATTWKQLFTTQDVSLPVPPARRGAAAAILPRNTPNGTTSDDMLMYFGGHRADSLFGGLWGLEFKRTARNERIWREIGTDFDPNQTPPPVTYHTLNVVVDGGGVTTHHLSNNNNNSNNAASVSLLYLFGGLNWTQSDLSISDVLSDSDRRCFMSARNIMKTACDDKTASDQDTCALVVAKADITSKCASSNSTAISFCCGVDLSGPTALLSLSTLCTSQCQNVSFQAQISLGFGEGLWVYNPTICVNNCSSHGDCMFSQCYCQPGWSGNDCSIPNCPGSFCYYDPLTKVQHCNYCSGNGACNNVNGTYSCECESGWAGNDCSAITCNTDCVGGTNGQCLDMFPIQQCVCRPGYSGMDCTDRLCLNGCSLAGTCQKATGTCACKDNFYGDDCSVYVPTLAGAITIAGHNWYLVPALVSTIAIAIY